MKSCFCWQNFILNRRLESTLFNSFHLTAILITNYTQIRHKQEFQTSLFIPLGHNLLSINPYWQMQYSFHFHGRPVILMYNPFRFEWISLLNNNKRQIYNFCPLISNQHYLKYKLWNWNAILYFGLAKWFQYAFYLILNKGIFW